MRPKYVIATTLGLGFFCLSTADGQSVLAPGQVAAVTSDGFFIPDRSSSTPHVIIPPAAFGGAAVLAHPAVEWERGTDNFLVVTGARLFQVRFSSLTPPTYSVTDITPASGQPLNLFDLDMHLGTDELYLLDLAADEVLRYAHPFAQGMTPLETFAVAPTGRGALSVAARSHPNAFVHAESTQVTWRPIDGASSVLVTLIDFVIGLDHDPRIRGKGGTFMVARGSHTVGKATGSPNAIIGMNFLGPCAPLALSPVDIEWDPITNRAFVLAEEGLNNNGFCFSSGVPGVGPNQIVKFPVAQIPGGPVVPTLYTAMAGSGITGTGGDIAIVHADFGFVSPYGSECAGGGGPGPRLHLLEPAVTISMASMTLRVSSAPAGAPVWFLLGLKPSVSALPSGCLLLVTPDAVMLAGTTDAAGDFSVTLPLPPLPVGINVFLQSAVAAGGRVSVTQGLRLHIGL